MRRPRADERSWLREQLPSLVVVTLLGSLAVAAFVATRHYDRLAAEQYAAAEAARVASRQQVFDRGRLGEMLTFCRDGWREELHFHHEPSALAWTRRSVDGYFLEGIDGTSLRQVRCDAKGVERGPRVPHPLQKLLPVERPAESEVEDASEGWGLAMAHLPEGLAAGEVAFELVRHPVTGQVFARHWRMGAAGAVPAPEPADVPRFALLVAAPDFQPAAAAALAPLEPIPRHDWLAEPDAAFDLIARELPAGALLSEVTLEPDKVEVQVAHPTKAFDGKPKAPFGDMEWDEYGVADRDWWYPREIAGFGCETGQPVAVVRAAFARALARRAARRIDSAWYSCSPAYSNGREGTWTLLPTE